MNTLSKGAIRPKSAPLSPAVPVLLEAVEQDLLAVRGDVPAGSALWHLAESARYAVSLALRKIEADRTGGELAGQPQAGEARP